MSYQWSEELQNDIVKCLERVAEEDSLAGYLLEKIESTKTCYTCKHYIVCDMVFPPSTICDSWKLAECECCKESEIE